VPAGAHRQREREYEELKDEFKQEHRLPDREEEVAARIVNKQRAAAGEAKSAAATGDPGESSGQATAKAATNAGAKRTANAPARKAPRASGRRTTH